MVSPRLVCALAALAAAAAVPAPPADGWRPEAGDDAGERPPPRQVRRIAGVAEANSVALTTTTPAPTRKKKLVTLAPGGDSIQAILFNNGYREKPADAEPEPNNIDNYDNLGGLDARDVWLLDDDLLVLRAGQFGDGFVDTTPIDDYQAPYREPKFPPPGFLLEGELPPELFGVGFAISAGGRPAEALIPELLGRLRPLEPHRPPAQPYNSQSYGRRRRPASNGHAGYRLQVPSVGLVLPNDSRRPHTYSVRTSYSSTSSMSSTSSSGPDHRYLPPPARPGSG